MIYKSLFFYLLLVSIILSPVNIESKSVFKEGQIFQYQGKHVHSSSIVETPSGDLLACWFHGSGERTADDVIIQGSRLKKGAEVWDPVFLMADTPEFPDCNPVLFIDKNKRLWLFWTAVLAHRWEKSILKYRISDNYLNEGPPEWSWQDVITLKPGENFAKAVKDGFNETAEESLWAEYAPSYTDMIIEAARDPIKRQLGWMTRTHPLILQSGRIILPLYSDGFCLGLTAISDDNGETWKAGLPMVGPGLNQPSIVLKKNGTLVAFLRDEGAVQTRVMSSQSIDNGQSWSYAEKTEIPTPCSSLEVIVLKNGGWVMVYNDTEEGRHRLAAALSDDEGKTWKWKNYIKQGEKGKYSFSYPSLIQTEDGLIHVTYSYSDGVNKTIKHTFFNVDWIKSR